MLTLDGCRSVDNYMRLNLIDEGTYGRVYRARELSSGMVYALKQIKLSDDKEGFPITALREINILLSLTHHHVVQVKEVVVGSTMDKIYMVMEHAEHDLKDVLDNAKRPFGQAEVKSWLRQLLLGVEHLHGNWILHRDLKTSNILLMDDGSLKICDFGLARNYGDPMGSFTQTVQTLWYRAPEVLFGTELYTPAIDIWSVGCIFAEMLARQPLLNGSGELSQISKMIKLLGSPTEEIWPGFSRLPFSKTLKIGPQPFNYLRKQFVDSPETTTHLTGLGYDLLNSMLTYDPSQRITASNAVRHPYFDEPPLPVEPDKIQTFPEFTKKRKPALIHDGRRS